MATGSANSRRQTITATAPFSPRKPREQSVSKRGESDKRALSSLGFFAERSLHTGEVADVAENNGNGRKQQERPLVRGRLVSSGPPIRFSALYRPRRIMSFSSKK